MKSPEDLIEPNCIFFRFFYLEVLEFPSYFGKGIEISNCNRRVKLFALPIDQLAVKLTDHLAATGPCVAY